MHRFSTQISTPSKRPLAAVVIALAVAAATGVGIQPVFAAEASVDLGTAADFGVLASSTVTNTGPTEVGGNAGVSPGTAITGFPPGIVAGSENSADAVAAQAQVDLTAAYGDAASRVPTETAPVSMELGGKQLVPGVYSSGELTITGDLTLAGDANSVWIFQAESTLITADSSRVLLDGPINPCNVFWQIGSSATLETGSTIVGNVMALTSITAKTSATVTGRLLAQNGAVTLDSNIVPGPLACTGGEPPLPPGPDEPTPPAPPASPIPGDATFTG